MASSALGAPAAADATQSHTQKEGPRALARPTIVRAAPSILAFSMAREEEEYTKIQNAREPEAIRELSMGEINMRRYLVSVMIGDQGDCERIDSVVQSTIDRDRAKRSALLAHLKAKPAKDRRRWAFGASKSDLARCHAYYHDPTDAPPEAYF